MAKTEIFPLGTEYYPAGQKFARNRSISYSLRYSHFFIFCKNPRWLPKVAKIEIFPLCIGDYPAGQKFARNRYISYGFRDIHTFSFSAKIQDGCQKWRKLKFFPFAQDTTLWVKNSLEISLSRTVFEIFTLFFIFRNNPRWPPKVAKIENFPLCIR